MADFSYMIDYKIKNTIDNKLNPYIKMIRDRMRDIDNKSTSSVLEVKKMLDEFLSEYNQFRTEVSIYVESLSDMSELLEQAGTNIETLTAAISTLESELSTVKANLSELGTKYNNHLSKKYYAVSHYVDGGTNVKNYSILEGQSISAPTSTKENYNLIGWYSDEDFSNKVEFPLIINDNIDLHAKWEEIVYYTITFITPYGSVENMTVEGGTSVSLPTLTYDGYYFKGWYSDDAYSTKISSPVVVNGDMVLYARWTEQITISFVSEYSTFETMNVEKGSTVILPSPTHEEYLFNGWFTDTTYATEITSPMIAETDITLYAKWTGITTAVYISELAVRYIKWMQKNGGTHTKPANVFTELQAFDSSGNNVALNKPVKYSWDENGWTTGALVNNGDSSSLSYNTSSTNYTISGADYNYGRNSTITIDLETPTNINSIKRWSWHGSNSGNQLIRTRRDTLYVSEDGIKYYCIVNGELTDYSGTDDDTGVEVGLTDKLVSQCPVLDLSYTVKDMGIRYLRWKCSGDEKGYGTPTIPVEIECYDNTGTNIALTAENKLLRRKKSDGTTSWGWGTNEASVADDSTVYVSGGAVGALPGCYIELDLGQKYNIKRVVYYPYFTYNCYYDFVFEVSNDGVNYHVIDNLTAFRIGGSLNGTTTTHKTQRELGTPLKYYLDEINPNDLEICTIQTGQETTTE